MWVLPNLHCWHCFEKKFMLLTVVSLGDNLIFEKYSKKGDNKQRGYIFYSGQIIISVVFQVRMDEIPFLCSLKVPRTNLSHFCMPLPIFSIQGLYHNSVHIVPVQKSI